jgi:hypothetical protein
MARSSRRRREVRERMVAPIVARVNDVGRIRLQGMTGSARSLCKGSCNEPRCRMRAQTPQATYLGGTVCAGREVGGSADRAALMRASGLVIRQTRAEPLVGEHCVALGFGVLLRDRAPAGGRES